MTWEIVQFEELEMIKDKILDKIPDNNLELPPNFLPNLPLVLSFTV